MSASRVTMLQIVAGLFVFGKIFSFISPGVLGFIGVLLFVSLAI